MRQRLSKGIIQAYYGTGKGKTTASLGLAFRATGHGFKVQMVQFMKGEVNYGEIKAAKNWPNLTITQFGRPEIIADPESVDIEEANKALEFAKKIIEEDECDILILDEVGVAIEMGLINVKDVIGILQNKPPHMEIILTGRYMHSKLLEMADLVTEMRMIKHPFVTQGMQARKGVDF
ncbi:MAG: cob(I)yrinic acid a,c-diamide adenosyltransferase [Candidatus Jordarchaeum sp.]|uniref:cob(I)yrinic acid a,c-diamide adenosyltransferase n=1 Tax=Candidatus Jordarchaeum sp. TaxID=2823881 RepID=UPI00404902E2